MDQDHGRHHKQGCRNTLAADIRNDHGQMIIINQEEIIKISAHFPGGQHRRVNIELRTVRKCGKLAWQHIVLDAGRHLDILLLQCHLPSLLHIQDAVHQQNFAHDDSRPDRQTIHVHGKNHGGKRHDHVGSHDPQMIRPQILPLPVQGYQGQHQGQIHIDHGNRIKTRAVIVSRAVYRKIDAREQVDDTHGYRYKEPPLYPLIPLNHMVRMDIQKLLQILPEQKCLGRLTQIIKGIDQYIKNPYLRYPIHQPGSQIEIYPRESGKEQSYENQDI